MTTFKMLQIINNRLLIHNKLLISYHLNNNINKDNNNHPKMSKIEEILDHKAQIL